MTERNLFLWLPPYKELELALPQVSFEPKEMATLQRIVDTFGGALTFDGTLKILLPEHSVNDLVEALVGVEMADLVEITELQTEDSGAYNKRSSAIAA